MRHVACLLAATLLLAACQSPAPTAPKPSTKPDPILTIANKKIKQLDWAQVLVGSLVFTAGASERGKDTTTLTTGLFVGLVANGLDFASIAQYKPAFADGVYTLTKNDTGISFRLFHTKDFGDAKAGDPIAQNLLAPDSYVTNPRLEGLTPTFDNGPLSGLVTGDITLGLDLKPKMAIDTSAVAFELGSTRTYKGQAPRTSDSLKFQMASTRTSIDTFNDQLAKGGFGVSFGGSAYDSSFFGVKQDFDDFPFLIKQDKDGAYFAGTYKAAAKRGDLEYWMKGTVSTRDADETSYYEDAACTKRIGVAKHAKGLKSGSFTFDDGPTLKYGLEAIEPPRRPPTARPSVRAGPG